MYSRVLGVISVDIGLMDQLLVKYCATFGKKCLSLKNRVLLEKLVLSDLIKKFPAFFGFRSLIADTCPYPEKIQSAP